jgi:hypothetical protein
VTVPENNAEPSLLKTVNFAATPALTVLSEDTALAKTVPAFAEPNAGLDKGNVASSASSEVKIFKLPVAPDPTSIRSTTASSVAFLAAVVSVIAIA